MRLGREGYLALVDRNSGIRRKTYGRIAQDEMIRLETTGGI